MVLRDTKGQKTVQRQFWPLSNREKYERFKEQNPHIYQAFLRYAIEALNSGRRRYSVKDIASRVRWWVDIENKSDEESFKIDNNHISYLARDLVKDEPRLEKLFHFRRIREC